VYEVPAVAYGVKGNCIQLKKKSYNISKGNLVRSYFSPNKKHSLLNLKKKKLLEFRELEL